MPTLQEWTDALTVPRLVQVESSQTLIDAVNAKHTAKDADLLAKQKTAPVRKANLTVLPAFDPVQSIQVIPAALLHRLGVVTTPQVENLADLSSIWAYIRYIWAFALPDPATPVTPLRLSQAARDIDFHQKAVLSDQIGVAMAAWILEVELGAALSSDVSVAMTDPAWPIATLNRSSPDYLFFNAEQTNLFIVECKGTQSSRTEAVDQIRRACEQVASLVFTDGRPQPPAILVATYLSPTGTRALILDPPGDGRSKQASTLTRGSEREWNVKDDARFLSATRRLSEARLLLFAGLDQAAEEKLTKAGARKRNRPRSTPRIPTVSESESGQFLGNRQRVSLKDGVTLEVFQGIEREVADAFIADDLDRSSQALRRFNERPGGTAAIPRLQSVQTEKHDDVLTVRSTSDDGSMLEIRVSPQ